MVRVLLTCSYDGLGGEWIVVLVAGHTIFTCEALELDCDAPGIIFAAYLPPNLVGSNTEHP